MRNGSDKYLEREREKERFEIMLEAKFLKLNSFATYSIELSNYNMQLLFKILLIHLLTSVLLLVVFLVLVTTCVLPVYLYPSLRLAIGREWDHRYLCGQWVHVVLLVLLSIFVCAFPPKLFSVIECRLVGQMFAE